jgi:hypothetical protein
MVTCFFNLHSVIHSCTQKISIGSVEQPMKSEGKMSTEFGAEITIYRLRPPLGGVYHYAAKIRPVYRSENGARARFRLPFDEVWGESEGEVRRNAAAIIARLVGNVPVGGASAMRRSDGQVSTDSPRLGQCGGEVGEEVPTVAPVAADPVADRVDHALTGQPA